MAKKKTKKKKKGLYANIHAKRKRIKAGSKEKMRKPGSKGAPTNANFKRAKKTAKKTTRKTAKSTASKKDLEAKIVNLEAKLNKLIKKVVLHLNYNEEERENIY